MVCAMAFLYYKLFLYVAFLPTLTLLMALESNGYYFEFKKKTTNIVFLVVKMLFSHLRQKAT